MPNSNRLPNERPRYYHGGPAGLRDEVLPPERTRVPSCADFGSQVARRDRVYLTTLPEAAMIFAAGASFNRPGWVYEVEPVGDVEPDPDYTGPTGESVSARRARIKRVHRRLTHGEVRAIRERVLEPATRSSA